MVPDMLCLFVRDAYVLTRHGRHSDGRLFEAALAEIANLLGFYNVQGPGGLTLFGTPAASKLRHELDLAMAAPGVLGLAEAKDLQHGVGKNDVMVFLMKTFDYYLAKLSEGRRDPMWRLLISATPVEHSLAVFCIQHGVIVVDPTFLPLPLLLRFVDRPEAEQLFDDAQLAEAVRLFEPACMPLERIFVPKDGVLTIGLDRFFGDEANDARWLAIRMSEDILLEMASQSSEDLLWKRAQSLRRSGSRALSQLLPSEAPE